jgi:large conductance mechanosensitive channel
MLSDFKAFVLRGNVLDLAVGVILGAAFNEVVSAFTDGVLMAAIAGVFGEPDFDEVVLVAGDARILVGTLLTAIVNLLLVGAALFLLVRVITALREPDDEPAQPEEKPAPTEEARLLAEIRDLLRPQAAK